MHKNIAKILNQDAEYLKLNQYIEYYTGVPANFGIVGRQYGRVSEANRAIRNFRIKYFASLPSRVKLWGNKIDEGCVEIVGTKD